MFTFEEFCLIIAVGLFSTSASAQDYRSMVGTPVASQELSKFFAVLPDGTGLPAGQGTASEGQKIYAEKCAHCHGEHLEGSKDVGGPAIIGGRGSLSTKKPLKTVESYWPYTSTLYDYIWRTMPFDLPGSLTPDQVYSLSAYILSAGKIIDDKQVMDAKSLPKVVMPNANGFYDGADPDVVANRSYTSPGLR